MHKYINFKNFTVLIIVLLFSLTTILVSFPEQTEAIETVAPAASPGDTFSCARSNSDGTFSVWNETVSVKGGSSGGLGKAASSGSSCSRGGGGGKGSICNNCTSMGLQPGLYGRTSNGTIVRIKRLAYPGDLTIDLLLADFYNNSLNVATDWAYAGEMKMGASGPAFDQLVRSLIDFGFINDRELLYITGGVPKTYDSIVTSGVTNLQKAFRLTPSGVFTIATRDAFKKFMLDALDSIASSGDKVTYLSIVWPDGRIGMFPLSGRFLSPSSTLTGIPTASTIPIFFRKDADMYGVSKVVYKWDSTAKKWNVSTVAFPPASTLAKSILTNFSTSLSATVAPVSTAFTANSGLKVVNGTASTLVPNIANILSYLGLYDQFYRVSQTNLDSTIITAIKKFDPLVARPVNETFDLDESSAVKDLPDFLMKAANAMPADVHTVVLKWPNNSFSTFDQASGVFYPAQVKGSGCNACPFDFCDKGTDKGICGGSAF